MAPTEVFSYQDLALIGHYVVKVIYLMIVWFATKFAFSVCICDYLHIEIKDWTIINNYKLKRSEKQGLWFLSYIAIFCLTLATLLPSIIFATSVYGAKETGHIAFIVFCLVIYYVVQGSVRTELFLWSERITRRFNNFTVPTKSTLVVKGYAHSQSKRVRKPIMKEKHRVQLRKMWTFVAYWLFLGQIIPAVIFILVLWR